MTTATETKTAALPHPIGINMTVYRDDSNWDKYSRWFMRPMHQIRDLFVAKITLAHYVDSEGEPINGGEPAYSHDEWCDKADRLLAEYPGCIFVYASN